VPGRSVPGRGHGHNYSFVLIGPGNHQPSPGAFRWEARARGQASGVFLAVPLPPARGGGRIALPARSEPPAGGDGWVRREAVPRREREVPDDGVSSASRRGAPRGLCAGGGGIGGGTRVAAWLTGRLGCCERGEKPSRRKITIISALRKGKCKGNGGFFGVNGISGCAKLPVRLGGGCGVGEVERVLPPHSEEADGALENAPWGEGPQSEARSLLPEGISVTVLGQVTRCISHRRSAPATSVCPIPALHYADLLKK